MRVSSNAYYRNFQNDDYGVREGLKDVTNQISSGKKIKYGFNNPTTFIDTLRLDNEVNSIDQVIKISQRAKKFSDYTDGTLVQITEALEKFKVKLVYAANEIHSVSSYNALASELKSLKEHLFNLANTSVDGKYLFAGTNVTTRPMTRENVYKGNDEDLKAFFGFDVKQAYNVTGYDLFFGQEKIRTRTIISNLNLYNQTMLHPDVMLPGNVSEEPKEVPINFDDTIRDLVGDFDSDLMNDEDSIFYLRGRRSDGRAFKEKIVLSSDAKVADLLDRIGIAFGNTQASKLVDLSLNSRGQIVLKDNIQGSSMLDFHMVSSKVDVDDLKDLTTSGAVVKKYIASDFIATKNLDSIKTVKSDYDHRVNTFPMEFAFSDGKLASGDTRLRSILGEEVDNLEFTGTKTLKRAFNFDESSSMEDLLIMVEKCYGKNYRNSLEDSNVTRKELVSLISQYNDKVELNFEIDNRSTFDDLMDFIKGNFGNLDVNMKDGKIYLFDNDIGPYGDSNFSLEMKANNKAFNEDFANVFDQTYWKKEGAKFVTNVNQIKVSDNSPATQNTKLVEVAGIRNIEGKTLVLDGRDLNGRKLNYELIFKKEGSILSDGVNEYNILDAYGNKTPANELTYRQLFDVISMVFSSTMPPANSEQDLDEGDEEAKAFNLKSYEDASLKARDSIELYFKTNGEIVLKDNTKSLSSIEISVFDKDSSKFSDKTVSGSFLNFNSNNALVTEDPQTDFFGVLDQIIEAVEQMRQQADGEDVKPRNIGMENGLNLIDNLLEHVTNEHTKNGAQTNTLNYSIDRNEILKVNSKTLRSKLLDTDIADASIKFNQLKQNYEALLSTTGNIKNLSLVNYL